MNKHSAASVSLLLLPSLFSFRCACFDDMTPRSGAPEKAVPRPVPPVFFAESCRGSQRQMFSTVSCWGYSLGRSHISLSIAPLLTV